MNNITEIEFWNKLNEPEPVISEIARFDMYVHTWYNDEGQLHRENDLPAVIWYRRDGSVFKKCWYQNDRLHRIGDPAMILYRKNGSIEREYRHLNGSMHIKKLY